MPVLVLGFAWFLAVAIELSPAGLLGGIAADLNMSTAAAGTLTTSHAVGNAILVLPLAALALRSVHPSHRWREAPSVGGWTFVAAAALALIAGALMSFIVPAVRNARGKACR